MENTCYIEKEPKKWLAEIRGVIAAFGDRTNCSERLLKSFAKEAPERAALIHGIDDDDIIAAMDASAWEGLEFELRNGASLKEGFPVIFALCYLDALVSINLITERMSEEIMEAIAGELGDDGQNKAVEPTR